MRGIVSDDAENHVRRIVAADVRRRTKRDFGEKSASSRRRLHVSSSPVRKKPRGGFTEGLLRAEATKPEPVVTGTDLAPWPSVGCVINGPWPGSKTGLHGGTFTVQVLLYSKKEPKAFG